MEGQEHQRRAGGGRRQRIGRWCEDRGQQRRQQQRRDQHRHRQGGTGADLAKRKSIMDLMAARLASHEAAEETHLWPAVRNAVPDGNKWADGALQQEQEGNETLAALGPLAPDTDEFDDLVEQLISQLRKHVAYEARVFLLLREAMPGDEREKLGRKLAAASKRGPARPAKRKGKAE